MWNAPACDGPWRDTFIKHRSSAPSQTDHSILITMASMPCAHWGSAGVHYNSNFREGSSRTAYSEKRNTKERTKHEHCVVLFFFSILAHQFSAVSCQRWIITNLPKVPFWCCLEEAAATNDRSVGIGCMSHVSIECKAVRPKSRTKLSPLFGLDEWNNPQPEGGGEGYRPCHRHHSKRITALPPPIFFHAIQ